jgi:hypothetical protein
VGLPFGPNIWQAFHVNTGPFGEFGKADGGVAKVAQNLATQHGFTGEQRIDGIAQ